MPAHNGDGQTPGLVGYRMFHLDEHGRVQAAAVVIEATDDKAAIRKAEEVLQSGHRAELWQGTRLVSRIGQKLKGQFAQQDMGSVFALAS